MEDEEKVNLVVGDEDKLSKNLKLLTNDAIFNQLVLLSETLKSHYELSNDDRNNYVQLLKFYDKIAYMNIDLLSLAILYISKHRFSSNVQDKIDLETFIVTRVVPFINGKNESIKIDERKKNNITINFVAYLISLNNYLNFN